VAEKALRKLALVLAAALLAFGVQAAPASKGPPWASLTADQQQVLAPLAAYWNELMPEQKRKWVGIAKRYPKMKPDQQQRVQRRMAAWAKLTSEQRWQARQQYRNLGKIAPDRREELRRYWAEYQSLAPHEKRLFDVPPVESRAAERKRRATPRNPGSTGPAPNPYHDHP